MKNKKMNNKGITLIALIITIIVMLILVGVTVNVALNGGIFENAKQARIDTEKNAILEQLIEMARWTQNGKVNVNTLIDKVEEKWPGTTYANGKLRITGKYGTYDYKVTEREISIWEDDGFEWSYVGLGNIETGIEYVDDEAFHATIIFSDDGTMKIISLNEGETLLTINAKEFKEAGKITLKTPGTEQLEVEVSMNDNEVDVDAILKDGSTITFVKENDDGIIISTEELLTKLEITNYTGTYTGNWKLIKTEGETETYVTTAGVGECRLGESEIDDYINASSKIESVVANATKEINARSVTIEDIEEILGIGDEEKIAARPSYGDKYKYYYDNGNIYSSYQARGTDSWGDAVTINCLSFRIVENGVKKNISDNNPGPFIVTSNCYGGDNESDPMQAATLGTLGRGQYWLNSLSVDCESKAVNFCVSLMEYGAINSIPMASSLGGRTYLADAGVRAIVTIESPIS